MDLTTQSRTSSQPEGALGKSQERCPGDVLGGKYRVLAVRRGGMGLVYLVEDLPSLQQGIRLLLALKTFQNRYLWNREAIARFNQEALHWVALGWHPHIVHALVVEEIEGKPYLWLECVEGESLAERLERGPLDPAQAVDLSLQFVSGMRHAHERYRLLHRDLKPGNLLLTCESVLKITDFGLAKLKSELAEESGIHEAADSNPTSGLEPTESLPLTGSRVLIGTPAYMPPEAIQNPGQVDARADIYSFGLVLHEMVTGRRVFGGADVLEQQLRVRPDRLRAVRAEVPASLDDLVAKCLEKDPERRFPSFREVEPALEAVSRELPANLAARAHHVEPVPEKARCAMKANSFMALGRLQEAVECFREAIRLDPDEAEHYNNAAVCLSRLGPVEEAVSLIEKALALRPDYAVAWSNLGGFCAAIGQHQRGLEACERALQLKSDWAEAHANLGANLVGLERYQEAESSFGRALQIDPSYSRAYVMAAEAAARRGARPEEMVPLLEKALAIHPRDAGALAFKAACLADMGKVPEAESYLQQAEELNPNDRLCREVRALFANRYR
ncbi:MAG: serine/threonine-protein kinase [Acidobacteria bacterium]|nr:serine/threonine-protein kinase [Acidobacteriota bacterium]